MAAPTSPVSPDIIFDMFFAYQRTAALKTAAELDLFGAFGGERRTAAELAARLGASERGVRILSDYMTIAGLLEKQGSTYALTPTAAAFLVKDSPAYLGSMGFFLTHPDLQKGFWGLTDTVRTGQIAATDGGTVAPENPVWVEFARSMAPMAKMAGPLFAERIAADGAPRRVLDVAAGHGYYGIALAKRDPATHVTALDWASVLTVAKEHAAQEGVADRLATIAGSAFDADWGGPYDVVLFTNFLHHFDPETCISLFRRAKAALAPGGRVATLEFVPNPDRVTPPMAAGFSLVMLAGTPSGDAYTEKQLTEMATAAGFARCTCEPLSPSVQSAHIAHT